MHASTLVVLAVAGLAAAQSSTTSPYMPAPSTSDNISGCGTQVDLIIRTCLESTQPLLAACPANDWDCMCTQSINVLTCYNNCPSSPDRFGQEQTKVANCNAASAYGTSSKTATTGSSSTGSLSAVVAAATTTTSGSPSSTDDASASGATATDTGAAVANAAIPAGGLLAAVFGVAALL